MERIRIIPLGGVGEIGKNMTLVEYGDDLIVVDCGSIFPRQDMLGIDLLIPDTTYLVNNRDRLRGYLITHGHEDHIGAMPYVYPLAPAPIYGSRLTLALIENKFEEHDIGGAVFNQVAARDTVRLGAFTVQFIHVSHSIADAMAMAITCPAGTVIFSGDFKIDYTPIDGHMTDLGLFAEYGNKGVLALLAESTNVEKPGHTTSERSVGVTLSKLFKESKGRIIIAMFASNLHRIQMLVENCIQYKRKLCFVGRSMINVTALAMKLGELKIPPEVLVGPDDIGCYLDNEMVILTTGSQGEPMSGLTRMANNDFRKLQIHEGDTVVISATPIPGNEVMVSRIIDQLYRCGAEVIYNRIADVHTSGHAYQDELRLLHALVKPKYFIPMHGEYRMLRLHAELAVEMGMPEENAIVLNLGQGAELSESEANIIGPIPSGFTMVDGLGVGDVGNVVLRDRKHLSEDGLIIVAIGIDSLTGQVSAGPEIISRGFVYVRDNEDIILGIRTAAEGVLERYETVTQQQWTPIKNAIKDELHTYIFNRIRRNPMILPIILET